VINSRKMIYVGHVTVWGIGEAYTALWWGDLREREHLGDAGEGGNTTKLDLQEIRCGIRTGSIWPRIGTGGWHLRMR